jgi:putative peptidoglycan lipid II flippase
VKIGTAAVVLNLAMNVAFMVPLRHIGPALATSLAAIFNVGGLGVVLMRRELLQLDAQVRRRMLRMVLASGVMGVVLWLTQRALFAIPLHGVARMAALGALVAVGLVAYGFAAAMFGAGDWRALIRMRGRGRRSSRAGGGAEVPGIDR